MWGILWRLGKDEEEFNECEQGFNIAVDQQKVSLSYNRLEQKL